MELFRETNIDFIGLRKAAALISGTLILITILSIIYHGGLTYGIDFTGGTSINLIFEKNISTGELRDSLSKIRLGEAEIKRVGHEGSNEFIIRVGLMGEGSNTAEVIEKQFSADFTENPYEIMSVTEIGPKIGSELRNAALMAIMLAMVGILIYVTWRFELKFAVAAIIALLHDVAITLGLFSVLNLEFTLVVIAAFLTIVGYSINDKIVVADRIRENLKIFRRDTYGNIVNKSLNQTLSRTVITGSTTLFVLTVLFFLGGKVIHDFSFALLVGIIVGTYSSIMIAAPIVYEWQHRSVQKAKRHQ